MTIDSPSSVRPVGPEDDWTPVRFDGLLFLARILRKWHLIAAVTLVTALLGLAYALTRRPFFEAKASFLPPARDVASAGQMNAYSLFAPSLQAATYMGFLKSSTVQHDVVRRLNLVQIYGAADSDIASAIVGGSSTVDATQDGIVTIKTQASTPKLAADLANAYLLAVHDLTRKMAEDSLKQRASFYTDQLSQSRHYLEQAETSLQTNQERGGILDPGGTTQIAIATQARLQAAIQSAEVQLSSLLQSNTESSPAVVRAQSEVGELRAQLARQSSKLNTTARGVEAGGALPGLTIEAIRRTREVKEREAVYESLLHQTQMNHMGQEDPGPELQVIDVATIPRRKAGPGRMRYLVGGTLFGFLASLAWVIAADWLRKVARRMRHILKSAEVIG